MQEVRSLFFFKQKTRRLILADRCVQQLLVVTLTWDRITFTKQFATFLNDSRYLITVLVMPSGDQKEHILIS